MRQLREFAQHSAEFDQLKARLVGISADDQEHAYMVWDKAAGRKFVILSDPAVNVIRQYGLLHASGGKGGEDIALRTTFVIDGEGRERWRRTSNTVLDIPKAQEALARLNQIH